MSMTDATKVRLALEIADRARGILDRLADALDMPDMGVFDTNLNSGAWYIVRYVADQALGGRMAGADYELVDELTGLVGAALNLPVRLSPLGDSEKAKEEAVCIDF